MNNVEHVDSIDPVNGLSDLILKYDMAKMIKEAESEFDTQITTHELVDQKAISSLFNLKDRINARN